MDKVVIEPLITEQVEELPVKKRSFHSKPKVYDYLVQILGDQSVFGLNWISEGKPDDVPEQNSSSKGLVNLHRINDIRRINKYFEAVNRQFEMGQYLVVTLETKNNRKERILNKYPKIFSRIYYLFDFILKRVFPKWKPTRRLYFFITKGRNRVISLTEGLGRMVCCGFEIVDFKQIENKTYIIGQKIDEPAYDMQPTYGGIIRLRRVGQEGKLIDVFKVRTMHPYSEYLQDYVFEKNDLRIGGKFKNDFRMTGWGKFLRKYWIDELPMIINWIKGELKLVGVRPLSRHYFDLYPTDLQELRTKVKPGLVPPYYRDMPETLEEIQASERKYLQAYQKNPIRTDLSYFFRSVFNILFRGARSQ